VSPQPLARVRPKATVLVTPRAITLRPELGLFVAEIIARWAAIEGGIGAILSHMLGVAARPVMAMLNAVTSTSAQMDMIEAAGGAKLFDPDLEIFEAVIKVARGAAKKRNAIAHHIWAYSEELPDALLLVDPEGQGDLSVRIQEAMYSTAKTTTLTLSPDLEWISVYRENDFRQIVDELKTLVECVQLLILYLHRITAHDQIYRKLCSEPLIDAALQSIRKNRPPRPRPQQPNPQTENGPTGQ
jgi:hypothetical protein